MCSPENTRRLTVACDASAAWPHMRKLDPLRADHEIGAVALAKIRDGGAGRQIDVARQANAHRAISIDRHDRPAIRLASPMNSAAKRVAGAS